MSTITVESKHIFRHLIGKFIISKTLMFVLLLFVSQGRTLDEAYETVVTNLLSRDVRGNNRSKILLRRSRRSEVINTRTPIVSPLSLKLVFRRPMPK
jgi:hypothetical protein